MTFYFDPTPGKPNYPVKIFYENEDIRMAVAELSIWKGEWVFAHTAATCLLEDSAVAALKAFVAAEIEPRNTMIKITARLLK